MLTGASRAMPWHPEGKSAESEGCSRIRHLRGHDSAAEAYGGDYF